MKIVRKSGEFPRTRLRDPGQDRKVKFSKSLMPLLVQIVREEGKKRIVFTDILTPGLKAVVSETGRIVFWYERAEQL